MLLYSMTQASSKVSITIRSDLMRFLENYQKTNKLENRSAVINQALEKLRNEELAREYAAASLEWDNSPDAEIWDRAVGDGL